MHTFLVPSFSVNEQYCMHTIFKTLILQISSSWENHKGKLLTKCMYLTLSMPLFVWNHDNLINHFHADIKIIRRVKKNSKYNLKIFHNSNFYCHIWIQNEKYLQMSTNKPSIGPVVTEISLFWEFWENNISKAWCFTWWL